MAGELSCSPAVCFYLSLIKEVLMDEKIEKEIEEDENRNRRIFRKIKSYINKIKRKNAMIIIEAFTLFIFAMIIVSQHRDIVNLSANITSLKADQEEITNKYNLASATNQSLFMDYYYISNENADLKESVNELQNSLSSCETKLAEATEDNNIEADYSYALYDDYGNKTDITVDQIKNLKYEATDLGMTQDSVDVALSIAMHESGGQEAVKNPCSTAAGYCGILDTTGKYVWNDIMGNDNYSYSLLFNGEDNLSISLNYIKYLTTIEGDNLSSVLTDYAGLYNQQFLNFVNGYLNRKGKSIYTVKLLNS